jgi:hypothetical protein
MNRVTKGLVAGLAAATTVAGLALAPTMASAQSYYNPGYGNYYGGGYNYDPCQRDTTERGTTGGLVGAAIGATVGSNIAAHGVRTEGAVLGGLVGAALGASVGQQSAACSSAPYAAPPPPPAPVANYPQPYYGSGYDQPYYGSGYDQPYARPHRHYRDYGYNDPYDDGGSAYGYPASQGSDGDQCTLAESPIYLPDGRTQQRFVRVCRDASGRYQVVD